MPKPYTDLHIVDDDICVDAGGQPLYIDERQSIAQDIVHMIRESGLLVTMIANRSSRQRAANMVKITLAVDNDVRIVAGSTEIDEVSNGELFLTAQTVDYGRVKFYLSI